MVCSPPVKAVLHDARQRCHSSCHELHEGAQQCLHHTCKMHLHKQASMHASRQASICVLQARQLTIAGDQDLIFHPSGSIVQCLHMFTGQQLGVLKGHLDTVTCCCYNSYRHELYSGSNDCNIIVWSAPTADVQEEEQPSLLKSHDQDAWSD